MKAPQLQKSLFLTAGIIFLAFICGFSQDGKTLFETNCKVCHNIGTGDLIGPDLAGVTDRRTEAWLLSFIKSSTTVINSGDADAVALFEKYNKMMMPDQPLDDAQIRSILGYIAPPADVAGDTTKAAAPAPKEVVAEPVLVGDALAGQELFTGVRRFESRGASCNSCHNVNHAGLVTGGAMAKDLTDVFGRLGDPGTRGMIAQPAFPQMKQAYLNSPVTPQEVSDLVAFLEKVNAEKEASVATDAGNYLLFGGLGGVTLLLALFSLLWMRRKRGSVNQAIYDRQTKAESLA